MTFRSIIKIWFIVSTVGFSPVFLTLVLWGLVSHPVPVSDGCILPQIQETWQVVVTSNLFLWLGWAASNLVASVVGLWGWSRVTGKSFSLTHHSSGTPNGAP